MIYSNVIITSPSGYIITRVPDFEYHVLCKMNRNGVVETQFEARNPVDITKGQQGNYDMSMSFYETSLYVHQVKHYPYMVNLNQYLYAEIKMNSSDPHLKISIKTCVASPDHSFGISYYLSHKG